MNELEPISGEIKIESKAKIGYYNQHFENQLPLDKTPIQYLQSIIPKEFIWDNIEQSVRKYLGQIKLEPNAHCKLISELSGGQKARVAITKLIFMKPHLLILDEPTNHLDIETVEALINALENFSGGLLIITHEPELIERTNSSIWMMDTINKSINTHIESYQHYCKILLNP